MGEIEKNLLTARDIVQKGWTKHHYHSIDDTLHCALGAIEIARGYVNGAYGTKESSMVARHLNDILGGVVDLNRPLPGCDPLPFLNDQARTTQQDVVQAFEKAACEAAEKGI